MSYNWLWLTKPVTYRRLADFSSQPRHILMAAPKPTWNLSTQTKQRTANLNSMSRGTSVKRNPDIRTYRLPHERHFIGSTISRLDFGCLIHFGCIPVPVGLLPSSPVEQCSVSRQSSWSRGSCFQCGIHPRAACAGEKWQRCEAAAPWIRLAQGRSKSRCASTPRRSKGSRPIAPT